MAVITNHELAVRAPDTMAIFSENTQIEWRNFALGALITFEGHKFGHRELFANADVIDTLVGVSDVGVLWPGRLMAAMHSRGYSIATSRPAEYTQLANEVDVGYPGVELLTDEEVRYARSNARIIHDLFNTALPSFLKDSIETGAVGGVAQSLVEHNWAVMLTPRDGTDSRLYFPSRTGPVVPVLSENEPMNSFVLHALKAPMY